MFSNPGPLLDGLMKPPQANYPPMSRPDGGYDWGRRGFTHPNQPAQPMINPPPGLSGNVDPRIGIPDLPPGFVPKAPMMPPHNPVPPGGPISLAQMRSAMTQLHMQQMLARLAKHATYHGRG